MSNLLMSSNLSGSISYPQPKFAAGTLVTCSRAYHNCPGGRRFALSGEPKWSPQHQEFLWNGIPESALVSA